MDRQRMLSEKQKNNKERAIKLMKRLGPMTLGYFEEKYKEAYNEEMPFACIDEKAQHDWLLSIPSVVFDIKRFKYSYIDRKRSKSAPFNDHQQPCSSVRQSRVDSQRKLAYTEDSSILESEPSGISTPITESPEQDQKVAPKSCLKKINCKENENQKNGQESTKGKVVLRERGKSENRGSKKTAYPTLYGSIIIGDDFPLGVVIVDLNYQDDVDDILLCKSGMTIRKATEIVQECERKNKNCLIYLGSVDIIQGRTLADLENDFKEFIHACRSKLYYPTLCTLAPIPTHQLGTRKQVLIDFNKYLIATAYDFDLPVIDIHKTFIRVNGSFEEYCYAVQARAVSGMKEWIAPWSKIGRERFHNMIKKNLGKALLADHFIKLDDI